MRPETRYARTADGVSTADQRLGDWSLDLVVIPTWVFLVGSPGARVHELHGVPYSPRLFAAS